MSKIMESNSSNIIEEKDYRELSKNTLKMIANSLTKSLGYYGSSTIVEDKVNGHVATKDGYTILSSLKFESPLSTTIYEIIKKISFNLVQTVGDGSTSSVVIANKLFELISDEMSRKLGGLKKYSPKLIFDTLKKIEEDLSNDIMEYATPIDDSTFPVIKDIATVSNNNDESVGQNIYDIYKKIGKDGFVYLENSHTNEDHYEYLSGLEFASGMIAEDFSNNKNKPECTFKEPFIFMCNDRLDSTDLNYMVDSIGNLVARHTKPVVIIAKSFSAEFVSCWIINKKQNPNLQICLVDFSFANKNQEEIFKDIAVYTNSIIYDKTFDDEKEFKNSFNKMLGSCDEIVINNKTTKIIGKNCTDKEIEDRVKYIDEEINKFESINENDEFSDRIFKLKTRKANLNSTIVKYFVGGDTELEKNTRKYLIEDSIFACRAALETGFVSGGNLTIPKIIYHNFEKHVRSFTDLEAKLLILLQKSFTECYRCVLSNSSMKKKDIEFIIAECINNNSIYNLKTKEIEKDISTRIVNSAKTEIEILKAVISIIGILVTSNQYISKSFA